MIYYCQMTQNRLRETIESINRVINYVDKVIVVDGGSIDDTIVYMRNWSKVDSRIEFYIYPWRDNFPKQRNNYLKHVPPGNWVIVSDPDEWFKEDTVMQFRTLATEAEKHNLEWNGYMFRAHDIFLMGEKVVYEKKPENSYKPLMFYRYEDTHYDESRNPHELLVCGIGYRYKKVELFYEHRKQVDVIWIRGARNFFVGGGGPNLGPNNPIWIPFRDLVRRKTGIVAWDKFNEYLVRGNIDNEIKKWMIEHRHESGYDGASEVRELYKTYFRLYHLEEEPEELRNENIE